MTFLKLFNKITLREHYFNLYTQQYLDDVETYIKDGKLKVQKCEVLNLNNTTLDHSLIIVSKQANILNNWFIFSQLIIGRPSLPKNQSERKEEA